MSKKSNKPAAPSDIDTPELNMNDPADRSAHEGALALAWGGRATAWMTACVLGSNDAALLLACSLIAREHVALVGPAGEGKTLLASVMARLAGLSEFYRLLSRYSTPEEVVGPWSLQALSEDRYERKLGGGAKAEVVVLDEVFKANSPMLNALLGLLNERAVDGEPTPLQTCIGLSNEWPRGLTPGKREGGDESLSPLWDRFTFRYEVKALSDDVLFTRLLQGDMKGVDEVPRLDGLEHAQALCLEREASFRFCADVVSVLTELRASLATACVTISSRRWRKAVRAMCAHSVVRGGSGVDLEDLDVLHHVLWDRPDQRAIVSDAIINAMPAEARFLAEAVNEARALGATRGDAGAMAKAKLRLNSLQAEVKALGHSARVRYALTELSQAERLLKTALNDALGM